MRGFSYFLATNDFLVSHSGKEEVLLDLNFWNLQSAYATDDFPQTDGETCFDGS